MKITLSEFAKNPDRYIDILDKEDILITKENRNVARLTALNHKKGIADSLFGILPADVDLDKSKLERFTAANSK